jgi:hypothetical protein
MCVGGCSGFVTQTQSGSCDKSVSAAMVQLCRLDRQHWGLLLVLWRNLCLARLRVCYFEW